MFLQVEKIREAGTSAGSEYLKGMVNGQEEGNREVSCKLGPSGAGLAFMMRSRRLRTLLFKPGPLSRTLKRNVADIKRTAIPSCTASVNQTCFPLPGIWQAKSQS